MASSRAVGWVALMVVLAVIGGMTFFVLSGSGDGDVPDFTPETDGPPTATEAPKPTPDPFPATAGPKRTPKPTPVRTPKPVPVAANPSSAKPQPAPDYGSIDEYALSTVAPTFFGVVSGPDGLLGGAEVTLWYEMPMPFGYQRVLAQKTDARGQFIVDPNTLVDQRRYHLQVSYPDLTSHFFWNLKRGKKFTVQLQPGTELSGSVENQNEEKLADVEVIAQGKSWRESVRTDAEGRFTFPHAPAGALRVEARPEFYEPHVSNDAAAGDTALKLIVKAGPRVVGTVVDGTTNEPLLGVSIATGIPGNPGRIEKASTDEKGNYEIPGMPATFVTFFARLDGYSETLKNTKLDSKQAEFRFDFKLFPLGAIRGRVVDHEGNGIEGARIFLSKKNNFFHHVLDTNNPAGTTDATGAFLLQNVVTNPGFDTKLVADHPRFMRGESSVVKPTPGQIVEGVSIRLEKGLPFSGKVVSKVTGQAVKGAAVRFQSFGAQKQLTVFFGQGPAQPLSVKTDDEGEFIVEQLQKGRVKVEVEADGHLSFQEMVDVGQGGIRGKLIELSEGFTIAGRVVDIKGRGVPSVRLHAACGHPVNCFSNATTNQEGYFKVKNLKRGAYDLTARVVGFSEETKKGLQVGEDNIVFTLQPNGKITGTVTSTVGGPLAEFTVNLQKRKPDGTWQWYRDFPHRTAKRPGKTAAVPDGAYVCADIQPGTYKVTIRTKEHADAERQNVTVMSGAETAGIDFVLSPGNTVFGRVTDAGGLVPKGAHVTAQPLDAMGKADHLTPARTDRVKDDGTYRIKGLKAGTYMIKPMVGGYCQAGGERVVLGGDREYNVPLVVNKGGTVRVRIKNENNRPLSGAQVTLTDSSGNSFGAVDQPGRGIGGAKASAGGGDITSGGGDLEGMVGAMNRTNMSGELAIPQPMCPGPATLEVTAPGYAKVTKTIQIIDEREVIETVRMRRQ